MNFFRRGSTEVADDGLGKDLSKEADLEAKFLSIQKDAATEYEDTQAKLMRKQQELRRQANELAGLAKGAAQATEVDTKLVVQWTRVETTPMIHQSLPALRSGHASFTISANDPRIFVHGGAADSVYYNDLYALHTGTLKWNRVHTYLVPRHRAYHTLGLVGPSREALDLAKVRGSKPAIPRLLLFGGFHKGTIDGDVHILDQWHVIKKGVKGANSMQSAPRKPKNEPPPGKDEDIWSAPDTHGDVPLPRCNHTSTLVGGRHLVVYGGWHGDFIHDVYVLDVWSMVWEYKETKLAIAAQLGGPISGRAGHTACLLPGKKLLVFGGQNGKGQLDDLLLLNLSSMEWTRPAPVGRGPSRRSGHTATYDGRGRIYMFGGWDGFRMREDIHVLSVQGDPSTHWKWEELIVTGAKVLPRVGHTANWVDGKLWIFGGWTDGKFLNDVLTVQPTKHAAGSGLKGETGLDQGRSTAITSLEAAEAKVEEQNFVDDFKRQLDPRVRKAEEDATDLAYIQELNKQVDAELFRARNLIEERKLKAFLAIQAEEKSQKRRVAISVAALRRRAIAAEVEAGHSLQDAVQIADMYSEEELLEEGIQVGRHMLAHENKPEPPREKHPDDLTPEERAELFRHRSAFVDNVDHVDEILTKITDSGGLHSMWNGDFDRKQAEVAKRRREIGEIGSNLEAALETEKLLREQTNAQSGKMVVRAPPAKVPVRPHREEMGPEAIDIDCLIAQTPMPRVPPHMRLEMGAGAGAGAGGSVAGSFGGTPGASTSSTGQLPPPPLPPPPPPPPQAFGSTYPSSRQLAVITEGGGAGGGAAGGESAHHTLASRSAAGRARPAYAHSASAYGGHVVVPLGIEKALVTVQSAMRGHLERKRVRELRAVMIMQKHIRGWQVRKRIQQNKRRVKKAAKKAVFKKGTSAVSAFKSAATLGRKANVGRLEMAQQEGAQRAADRDADAAARIARGPQAHDSPRQEKPKITKVARATLRPRDY